MARVALCARFITRRATKSEDAEDGGTDYSPFLRVRVQLASASLLGWARALELPTTVRPRRGRTLERSAQQSRSRRSWIFLRPERRRQGRAGYLPSSTAVRAAGSRT